MGKELPHPVDVLLVQAEDPWQHPTGGIVAFTKCLLRAFGSRVAVAAPSEEPMPVGSWLTRPFEGRDLAYYNLGPLGLSPGKKPLVPAKIQVLGRIRQHMEILHGSGVRNLMLDSAEALFVAKWFLWDSVCYCFHGLSNPVSNSRYRWARGFGGIYQRWLLDSLRAIGPAAVIAAADERTCESFRRKSAKYIDPNRVHSFPTHVDTSVFYPEPKAAARAALQLPQDGLLLVVNGRLNWVKGWRLVLDVLAVLKRQTPDVHLVLVGDGEDRSKIEKQALRMGLSEHLTITGFLPQEAVRRYLNAADVCLVASHFEGWSLAMLEILACGKPLVSSDVSGARAMIRNGENGFVVEHRDPQRYATAILRAAALPLARQVSVDIADRYAVRHLAGDLGKIWKPLASQSSALESSRLSSRDAA